MYGTLPQRLDKWFYENRGVAITVAELAKELSCSKSPQLYQMLYQRCKDGCLSWQWGAAYGRPAKLFFRPEFSQPCLSGFEPQEAV